MYSNTTGFNNTANGNAALSSNTTGDYNTASGYEALWSNTTGNYNTAMGNNALYSNTEGYSNTAYGSRAFESNTTGHSNVGLGTDVNYYNEEGSNNTIIGYQAGKGTSLHNKSGNIFPGYQAGYNETGSDLLYIENSNSASPLIWGDFANDRLVINGNSTDNTSDRTFFVNGEAGGTAAWFNDSDIRLKKNISTINNALEKVNNLRGVNFEWINTENRGDGLQMGFIAQEVEQVIPEVVDNTGEYYSMQYAPVTALLVEAVKELKKQNEELRNQNSELEEQT